MNESPILDSELVASVMAVPQLCSRWSVSSRRSRRRIDLVTAPIAGAGAGACAASARRVPCASTRFPPQIPSSKAYA
ncbi:hypothetical protein SAMN05446635_8247 [Burkholderia sp. OK233]|nr:hypothetical protein SAMN05446635_8247 [Burkholderia sp. OK233]